jgi:hypothetical protein
LVRLLSNNRCVPVIGSKAAIEADVAEVSGEGSDIGDEYTVELAHLLEGPSQAGLQHAREIDTSFRQWPEVLYLRYPGPVAPSTEDTQGIRFRLVER